MTCDGDRNETSLRGFGFGIGIGDGNGNGSVNVSEAAGNDAVRSLLTLIAVLLSGVALILFAAVSNCFVIYAIVTKRSLRKRSNALYVSLAVADILVATCVMTLALANDLFDQWVFGDFMCHFWLSLDVMCCTASILSIAAVSFDRYLHISDPFAYERIVTKKLMAAVIFAIWLLSAIISFLPIGLRLHERQHDPSSIEFTTLLSSNLTLAKLGDSCTSVSIQHNVCKFEINVPYAIGSSLISFYLPCITVLVVYGKLYRIARQHYNKISHSVLTQQLVSKTIVAMGAFTNGLQPGAVKKSSSTTEVSQPASLPHESLHDQLQAERKYKKLFKEKKAAITLGFIISTFLVTWTPYFIVNVIGAFNESLIPHQLFVAVTYMGYMNSCIDPIVYVVFHADFRVALRTSIQRIRAFLGTRVPCFSYLRETKSDHRMSRRNTTEMFEHTGVITPSFCDIRSSYDAGMIDVSPAGVHLNTSRLFVRRKSKSISNLCFVELPENI